MEGSFSISVAGDRRFVRTILGGLWAMELADRFERETRGQLASHGLVPEDCVCLSQSLGYSLPPQDVAARMGSMFRWRRLAIVSASQLTRFQVNRVFAGQAVRVFDGERDAEAWLFEQG